MCLLEEVVLRSFFFALASSVLIASAGGGCGASTSHGAPSDDAGAGDDAGDDAATNDGAVVDGAASDGATTRDASHVDAGAAPPLTSAVTIIVEPGDNGQGLLNAIKNARTSVHMTMYLLSSSSIITALIAQKNAGHDVKVLLNQTFPQGQGSNQSTFAQLHSAGVNVKWAPAAFTFTHEKTVIIDAATAWIMTMNATVTSATDNREYLAVDTDATDVAEAESIFESDFAGTATSAKKLVAAPDNAFSKLLQLIASASATIDIEAEELSDTQIVTALSRAADGGVKVRVVIASGTGTPAQTTAIATLKQHGVRIVSLSTPYIHAKSLVVDGTSAYVGSENFSTGSLGYNRELGVLFNAPAEVQKVLSTTSTDFSHGTAL